MLNCTADLDHPCNAGDNGESCSACKLEYEYWFEQWNLASPSEKNPEQYRQDMIEAGRGHLLK